MPNTSQGQLRRDAARNRALIIESALTLLGNDPDASMEEVANASGLGRTTVYRHFTSRDDLIRTLAAGAISDAREVCERAIAEGTSPQEILRTLAAEFIAIGSRYRFLDSHRDLGDEMIVPTTIDPSDPTHDWLVRAQSAGEIRSDFPVTWMTMSMYALASAASREVTEGRVEAEDATRHLAESLIAIITG